MENNEKANMRVAAKIKILPETAGFISKFSIATFSNPCYVVISTLIYVWWNYVIRSDKDNDVVVDELIFKAVVKNLAQLVVPTFQALHLRRNRTFEKTTNSWNEKRISDNYNK